MSFLITWGRLTSRITPGALLSTILVDFGWILAENLWMWGSFWELFSIIIFLCKAFERVQLYMFAVYVLYKYYMHGFFVFLICI